VNSVNAYKASQRELDIWVGENHYTPQGNYLAIKLNDKIKFQNFIKEGCNIDAQALTLFTKLSQEISGKCPVETLSYEHYYPYGGTAIIAGKDKAYCVVLSAMVSLLRVLL
jgi:hypothetical protein